MATPPKAKDHGFDPAKLQAMVEPISVRVDKIKGQNQKMPIELPSKSGGAPGTDWTRDDVARLENWLLKEWTGGGFYSAIVVDSQGNRMEWEFVYDPKQYPERPAPNTAEAMNPSVPYPTGVQTAGPSASMMSPLGSSPISVNFPPFAATVAQPVPQQQQQQQQPQQPMYQPPMYGAPGPWGGQQPPQIVGYAPNGMPVYGQANPMMPGMGMPGMMPGMGFGGGGFGGFGGFGAPRTTIDEGRRRPRWEDEDEKMSVERKRLEDEVRKLERERLEGEHKASIERIQNEHTRQIETLRLELRGSSDSKSVTENEALRREREERERIERERERERLDLRFKEVQDALLKISEKRPGVEDDAKRLIEEQNRRHTDEMQRLRDEQMRDRDRIEATQREERIRQEMKEQAARTETMLREASANKADPMIALMQENARQSAETSREIARGQQVQMQMMSSMMMSPTSLASLIKDNNSGADVMMKNIVGSFSGIFDTFRHAVEQITQLQGGGQESLGGRLAQEALGRVGEIADRYIGMQRDKVVSEAKAKTAMAQAQVQTAAFQAQATAMRQTQHTAGLAGAPSAAPTAPAAAAPATAPTPSNGQGKPGNGAGKPVLTVVPPATDDGTSDTATGQTVAAPAPAAQAAARAAVVSEEQMFGLALESTRKLRVAVKAYLVANNDKLVPEDVRVKDAAGKTVGYSADEAVDALLKGVNYVITNNVQVPIFALFQQGRYADFMDCVFPTHEFPQWLRDECVRILSTDLEVAEARGSEPEAEE